MAKTSGELYRERTKRIEDAIHLEEPDRVPILLDFGYLSARYSNMIYEEALYNSTKWINANRKIIMDFEPDTFHCIPFDYGTVYEAIDTRVMKWPGHGLTSTQSHQYIEGEYMMADEYDDFIANPTDFILRKFLPRTCGTLGSFSRLPDITEFVNIARGRVSPFFASPDFVASCQAFYKASQAAIDWTTEWNSFVKEIEAKGFPTISLGGVGQAPFDFISDYLRGMKGAMLDMYRQPDKLLAAMNRLLPVMINRAKTLTRKDGNNLVFMAPHRGAGGFMSSEQYKKFYWPGLKAVILAVIEAGFTPYIFWEGDYNTRLEYLLELPDAKVISRMDRTDMFKAKEILGGHQCLAGGILPSLLQAGSIQEVKDQCKRLIDVVGRDGGYIMNHSVVLDEAKPENVRAMVEFTKEYGIYS